MKTTLDLTSTIYSILNVSSIKNELGGGDIYKDVRPKNSDKRDIVITSTTVDNEAFQNGVAYVNIHDGGEMPAHAFFKTVVDKICQLLKARYTQNHRLLISNVAGPIKLQDSDSPGWYFTIRVKATLYYN